MLPLVPHRKERVAFGSTYQSRSVKLSFLKLQEYSRITDSGQKFKDPKKSPPVFGRKVISRDEHEQASFPASSIPPSITMALRLLKALPQPETEEAEKKRVNLPNINGERDAEKQEDILGTGNFK